MNRIHNNDCLPWGCVAEAESQPPDVKHFRLDGTRQAQRHSQKRLCFRLSVRSNLVNPDAVTTARTKTACMRVAIFCTTSMAM